MTWTESSLESQVSPFLGTGPTLFCIVNTDLKPSVPCVVVGPMFCQMNYAHSMARCGRF